jgi:hypothetical protein
MKATEATKPTTEGNYDYFMKLRNQFSRHEIAELTGYTVDTVQGWVAPTISPRWRAVPDRAIEMAKLKLQARGITLGA